MTGTGGAGGGVGGHRRASAALATPGKVDGGFPTPRTDSCSESGESIGLINWLV